MTTVEEYHAQRVAADKTKKEKFIETRARLLSDLRNEALLSTDPVTVFASSFDGYGDSGTVYFISPKSMEYDLTEVENLLSRAVDMYADWNWYNNDGGGGTIQWDIKTDTMTIEGHYNETVTTLVDEIEF